MGSCGVILVYRLDIIPWVQLIDVIGIDVPLRMVEPMHRFRGISPWRLVFQSRGYSASMTPRFFGTAHVVWGERHYIMSAHSLIEHQWFAFSWVYSNAFAYHPRRGNISAMIREVPSHIFIFETRFAVTGACISQSQQHSKPETRIDERSAAVNCQLATLYIHRARQMKEFLIDMPLRFASNMWKLSYPTAKVDQSAL